jgi:hypothetical protein
VRLIHWFTPRHRAHRDYFYHEEREGHEENNIFDAINTIIRISIGYHAENTRHQDTKIIFTTKNTKVTKKQNSLDAIDTIYRIRLGFTQRHRGHRDKF